MRCKREFITNLDHAALLAWPASLRLCLALPGTYTPLERERQDARPIQMLPLALLGQLLASPQRVGARH